MSENESTAGGPPAADAQPPEASEEKAWAAVIAAWGDEDVHRAYLARFTDIEGLAVAGARYKDVLGGLPGDEMALRMRGEILKKATAYGLAALPRTPATTWQRVKRLRMVLGLVAGVLFAWGVYMLLQLAGVRL